MQQIESKGAKNLGSTRGVSLPFAAYPWMRGAQTTLYVVSAPRAGTGSAHQPTRGAQTTPDVVEAPPPVGQGSEGR